MDSLSKIKNDIEMRHRLLNCFLVNTHYEKVMKKKIINFTSYINGKQDISEKYLFAKNYIENKSS